MAVGTGFQHPDEIYANQDIPETLIERIRCQKGYEKLDLSLCNLSKIPISRITECYGEPYSLDISFNAIRYISHQFCSQFVHLTRLDLSRNAIRMLPDNFGMLTELVYLDLHKNKLEGLPLGMGKMRQLQYLNIAENQFRPPLSDFLGERSTSGKQITCTVLAQLVTDFLQRLEAGFPNSRHTSEVDLLRERRSSRVHYRTKSITFGNESDDSSGNDANKLIHQYTTSSKRSSQCLLQDEVCPCPKCSQANFGSGIIAKTLTLLSFWLILIPIFVACSADTLYLEGLDKELHSYSLWSPFYKLVKLIGNPVVGTLFGDNPRPLLLRGAPPQPDTFLQSIFNMFILIRDAIWKAVQM